VHFDIFIVLQLGLTFYGLKLKFCGYWHGGKYERKRAINFESVPLELIDRKISVGNRKYFRGVNPIIAMFDVYKENEPDINWIFVLDPYSALAKRT
jgi:hypothetical protein